MKTLTYLKDVVTLELVQDKCIGCGMCMIVCPHAVFSMDTDHVQIENRDACMECGACARNCPANALFVSTGVGCAAALINSALGREGSCSCVVETEDIGAC